MIYRSNEGSLIYLAICTWPNNMFSRNIVAQHCKKSKLEYWKNVIQISRYLKESKYYRIIFNREKCLRTYVDSDYDNDKEAWRSITRFI